MQQRRRGASGKPLRKCSYWDQSEFGPILQTVRIICPDIWDNSFGFLPVYGCNIGGCIHKGLEEL